MYIYPKCRNMGNTSKIISYYPWLNKIASFEDYLAILLSATTYYVEYIMLLALPYVQPIENATTLLLWPEVWPSNVMDQLLKN